MLLTTLTLLLSCGQTTPSQSTKWTNQKLSDLTEKKQVIDKQIEIIDDREELLEEKQQLIEERKKISEEVARIARQKREQEGWSDQFIDLENTNISKKKYYPENSIAEQAAMKAAKKVWIKDYYELKKDYSDLDNLITEEDFYEYFFYAKTTKDADISMTIEDVYKFNEWKK